MTMRLSRCFPLLLVSSVVYAGGNSRFDLADPDRVEVMSTTDQLASAGPAPERMALLPTAIAVASAEARRMAANEAGALTVDAGGTVDVSLGTVVELALRNNLEIRVQSFSPALGREAVAQRSAVFDPLLRFTLSLLSSTSPTSASLEGAAVLESDRTDWALAVEKLTAWGGRASLDFNNQRYESNNVFSTLNPSYSSNLAIGLSQPLLRNFGKDITAREVRIARNDQAASEELFRGQVISTVTSVVDAYWDLFGKIETRAVRVESLSLANDLLKINRTRVEVGTMAPLEIAAAEAEVARNEEFLISAEHDVTTAQDRLLQLVNTPSNSPLWAAAMRLIDTPPMENREIDVEKSIATALSKRPELRRQQLAVDNDAIRLAYAKNQLKPSLNLQASYSLAGVGGNQLVRTDFGDDVVTAEIPGGYGDALDGLYSLDFDTWRIGAVFEFPLFNRSAKAGLATAKLNQQRDEASMESLEQAIAVDVRRLARTADTNRKRMSAAAVTRKLQEKRLDAAQKKLEHGLATNFEVSQALQDLTEAKNGEVLAGTSYRRALSALDSATGTVLETYGVEIEP